MRFVSKIGNSGENEHLIFMEAHCQFLHQGPILRLEFSSLGNNKNSSSKGASKQNIQSVVEVILV